MLAAGCLVVGIVATLSIPAVLDFVVRSRGGLPVILDIAFCSGLLGSSLSFSLSLLAGDLLLSLLESILGLLPCSLSGFGQSLLLVNLGKC